MSEWPPNIPAPFKTQHCHSHFLNTVVPLNGLLTSIKSINSPVIWLSIHLSLLFIFYLHFSAFRAFALKVQRKSLQIYKQSSQSAKQPNRYQLIQWISTSFCKSVSNLWRTCRQLHKLIKGSFPKEIWHLQGIFSLRFMVELAVGKA